MNQRAPKAVNVWLDTSQEITPDVWPYLLREGLALTAWSPQDLAKAVGCDVSLVRIGSDPPETTQIAVINKLRWALWRLHKRKMPS